MQGRRVHECTVKVTGKDTSYEHLQKTEKDVQQIEQLLDEIYGKGKSNEGMPEALVSVGAAVTAPLGQVPRWSPPPPSLLLSRSNSSVRSCDSRRTPRLTSLLEWWEL